MLSLIVLLRRNMPVFERILRGIARYRRKQYAQIFVVYMRFGQVDVGHRPYGKKTKDDKKHGDDDDDDDDDDFSDNDAQYKRDMSIIKRNPKSKHQKSLEKAEREELQSLRSLDVDFLGCTRQFLSTYMLRDSYFYRMDAFEDAPQVVLNFLKWMKEFNVCPEYQFDIDRSLMVCRWAADELPRCKQALLSLPGRFNTVCAARYGGQLYSTYGASQELRDDWTDSDTQTIFGLTKEQVEMLTDGAFGEVFHMGKSTRAMRVVRVDEYDPNRPFTDENPRILLPHGRVWLSTHDPEGHRPGDNWAETKESVVAAANEAAQLDDLICLYMDPSAANAISVGMVLITEFHQLSNGVWYIERVDSLWPSYYLDDVQIISDSDSNSDSD
ncbi:Argonaute complex, subunit Arb1 [Syncephalis plumigaleata]|nr:Argonaute complex, subunit Arb1 [Syncephalis plumigaleata]